MAGGFHNCILIDKVKDPPEASAFRGHRSEDDTPDYGKMNFYLPAVDDMLKHSTDQPTIGLILCKGKNQIVVEYALRNMATPMGIAEFRHLERLPEEFKGSLQTIEEIEAELGSDSHA